MPIVFLASRQLGRSAWADLGTMFQQLIDQAKAQMEAHRQASHKQLLRNYFRARFVFDDLADAGCDVCTIETSHSAVVIHLHLPPPKGLIESPKVISRRNGYRRIQGRYQGVDVTWLAADID